MLRKIVLLFVCYNFSILCQSFCTEKKSLKLELIQVLFRHGDRAAKQTEVYKTDPYDQVFKAIGYGQLTTTGKQREFKIGKMLKERYGNFVGNLSLNELYARSTDSDRTKMSLKLVIAGIMASSEVENFEDVDWQTIPITFEDSNKDILLTYSHCPRYKEWLDKVEALPNYRNIMRQNEEFYNHLREATKITTERVFTPFLIHNTIRAAQSLGLRLPEWCSKNDYKKLYEITSYVYDAMAETEDLRRLVAGFMIEEFVKNINHSEENGDKKKIYFYGAHDSNVAIFTRAHNFTNIPLNPDYGSSVIVEKLRGYDGKIYIRMFLWTGVSEDLIPLKFNRYGYICTLKEYLSLVESILPTETDRECISGKYVHNSTSNEPKPSSNYLMAGKDICSFKYPESYF